MLFIIIGVCLCLWCFLFDLVDVVELCGSGWVVWNSLMKSLGSANPDVRIEEAEDGCDVMITGTHCI